MKKAINSCLALVGCLLASHVMAQTDVTVVYKEGAQETLQVMTDGGLYFSGDNLVISTVQGNSKTVSMPSVRKLVFSSSVDLPSVATDGLVAVCPNRVTETLKVVGMGSDSFQFSVISVSGAILMNGTSSSNETINVSSLTAGFYLLKVDGQILKFTKL